MKRAVIYARYSSDKQREESIDAQVRACKDYCLRHHYLITKVYADEAKSGRDIAKRDAYNQMMADAVEGKFDIIIFHKIDRNSRNEFNYYTVQNTLTRLGVEYAYAQQPIDDSPEGKMTEAMLVAMAAYYSRNLGKETKKGLNENAYKALFNGGRPPLGYKIVDQQYEIEPHEAEAVRLIYQLYLAGWGYNKIAHALNAKGFKTREGRDFGKNSMYEILKNEKYMGNYTFNKTERKEGLPRNMHNMNSKNLIRVESAIPAIISEAEFMAVQKRREENRKRQHSYKTTERYLLSGKIFCGCCGSAMSGHRYTPRTKTYVYYSCNRKERIAAGRCPQKQISRDRLENWVIGIIKNKILADDSIKKIAADMAENYKNRNTGILKEKNALTTAKTMAERKLDNLYKLFENGNGDEYDMQRLENIKKELNNIKSKLKNLDEVNNLPELSEQNIESTLKYFKNKILEKDDMDAKKILIDLFVEQVTINIEEVFVTFGTKNVYMEMVPKTGLEPVRGSLPEGF